MNIKLAKLIAPIIKILMLIFGYRLFFGPKRTEVIKIVGVDSDGDLVLKDVDDNPAKIYKAKAGTKIKWQIHTVDVRSIVNIYKKTTPASDNIFSSGPEPINNSKDWKAVVDTSARYPQFILYNIDWKDNAGNVHIYDPRIQVKS